MKEVKAYILMLVAAVGIIISCESHDYEPGDGKYSYLHSDMVDVTVKNKTITELATDDGATLNIIPSDKTVDVTAADTTMRWLLYYNKVDDNSAISFIGHKDVSVLQPLDRSELFRKNPGFIIKTDTVKTVSVWMSKNNKYLNMNLALWIGNTESDKNKHSIGLIRDKVSTSGKGRVYYTLYHDQANLPVGYYTTNVYLSVKTTQQDTVDLRIGHTHYVETKR